MIHIVDIEAVLALWELLCVVPDLTNFVPTGLVPLPEVQIDGPITCTQVGELEVCST